MFNKIFFPSAIALMVILGGCKKNETPVDPGGGSNVPAKVMAVHASPGAPAIDIYLDTTRSQSSLSYGSNTGYVEVPVGIHSLKATVAGTQTVVVAIPFFVVTGSMVVTVFAADTGASIAVPYFFDTLATASSGKARIRFIHMAVKGPNLDLLDSVSTTTRTTVFASTAYLAGTSFTDISAGVHDFLIVHNVGPSQTVMARVKGTLTEGKSYTLFVKGLPGVSGSLGVSANIIANN